MAIDVGGHSKFRDVRAAVGAGRSSRLLRAVLAAVAIFALLAFVHVLGPGQSEIAVASGTLRTLDSGPERRTPPIDPPGPAPGAPPAAAQDDGTDQDATSDDSDDDSEQEAEEQQQEDEDNEQFQQDEDEAQMQEQLAEQETEQAECVRLKADGVRID